jgi:predicted RNase H-like HicB family nuclease
MPKENIYESRIQKKIKQALNRETAILEEYKTLREEIIRHQNLRLQILILCITITGVLIGLPLRWNEQSLTQAKTYNLQYCYILPPLALYAVLILCSYISRVLCDRIQFIGAYIATWIENEIPVLKWERNTHKPKVTLAPRSVTTGIALSYFALSVVALMYTVISFYTMEHLSYTINESICILFSICGSFLFAEIIWIYRSNRAKKSYMYAWHQIKTKNLVLPKRGEFAWSLIIRYGIPFILWLGFSYSIFRHYFVYTVITFFMIIGYVIWRWVNVHMPYKYILDVVIKPDKDAYHAYCPMLVGCHSSGDTETEAFENIQEAVRLHLEVMIKDGKIVPSIGIVDSIDQLNLVFKLKESDKVIVE